MGGVSGLDGSIELSIVLTSERCFIRASPFKVEQIHVIENSSRARPMTLRAEVLSHPRLLPQMSRPIPSKSTSLSIEVQRCGVNIHTLSFPNPPSYSSSVLSRLSILLYWSFGAS